MPFEPYNITSKRGFIPYTVEQEEDEFEIPSFIPPPIRFGKQLINIFSKSVKEAAFGLGGGKIVSYIAAAKLNKTLKEKGIDPPSLRDTQKRLKQSIMGQYKRGIPEFDITPATTVGEKATDIAAGITGFVAQLALLKKAFPGVSGAALWEMENLSSGGTPGVGAATYGVFNLPGKVIKGVTIGAKAGRIVSESVLLGGMSAAHQKIETGEINASEMLISAGIPLGLRAAGGAKGVLKRALKAKNPKAIRAVNEAIITKLEIPPGSNVYKTKEGRVVIEKPADIGTPQGTIMRGGRIYEAKKGGAELFSAPELSVSAIQKSVRAIAPVEGIERVNRELITWSDTAKHLRKTEVKAAISKLRRTQAARGTAVAARAIKAGEPAKTALRRAKAAQKIKALVPEVTPPDLTKAQWEGLSKRVFKLYPIEDVKLHYQRISTQTALDKLEAGRIPTDYDFGFLDKLLGRETTLQLHKNLTQHRTYSLMDVPWIARDMLKTTFAYDPQVARQFSGVTVRHPKITAEALIANKQAYIGKGIFRRLGRGVLRRDIKGIETGKQAATRIDTAIESMPEHKLAKKYMTFLENVPWKTHKASTKLQQYGGVSDFLLSRKSKVLRKWGEVVAASERGANSGINLGMQKLWNESEKELALRVGRKGMTPTQIESWRVQRGKEILTGIKRRTATTKQGRQIQRAANWFLFSPANTWSRLIQPLNVISGLARGQGIKGRTYAAQLLVTNIAKISAMGSIAAYTGHRLRANNPTETPHIDGSNDPTNSMWGKTRVGNDTFDPSGGDAPTYRMFARLGVSAYMYARKEITGKEGTFRPPGEVFMNWLNSRETVLIGLAKTLATGKDWLGKPIGRTEALLKAFPIEFIVSVVEAGGADGLWENLAEQGDIQEASKTFIKNIPVGLAGLAAGIGTATYPIKTITTRWRFKDIIAKKEYNKKWDDLTIKEQRRLSTKHRKAFDVFERKIKIEQVKEPRNLARIQEEQRKSGVKITKLLSKPNRKKVEGVSVQVSRSPKDFYLNDERYQKYQELVAKHLNEGLSKLNLSGKSDNVKSKMLEITVRMAKNKAFYDIRRAMR